MCDFLASGTRHAIGFDAGCEINFPTGVPIDNNAVAALEMSISISIIFKFWQDGVMDMEEGGSLNKSLIFFTGGVSVEVGLVLRNAFNSY